MKETTLNGRRLIIPEHNKSLFSPDGKIAYFLTGPMLTGPFEPCPDYEFYDGDKKIGGFIGPKYDGTPWGNYILSKKP
jgi:hypothetical protein